MSATGAAAPLWVQLVADVKALVNKQFDRRRALTVNAGTMTLQVYDGLDTRTEATYLRWPIKPGDDVITLRYANRDIVLGALSVPGDPTPPIPDGSIAPGSPVIAPPTGGGAYLQDGSQVI